MGRTTEAEKDMDQAATAAGTGVIDSREALIEALAAGERIKFLHFWGHRPLPDGRIGASCLSQWWPSPFTVDGLTYGTAEHWMMAAKARMFADPEAERRILAAGHPADAKKEGRLVRNFDEAVWRRERFRVVVEGSTHKFAAHADLRAFLLDTGDRVLVEASPRDRVWGIGLGAKNDRASDPAQWRGANLLGFALMRARARLRDRAGSSRTGSGAGSAGPA